MKQNVVQPSTLRTEKRNREYKPSPQLSINQQRAAEVYPHRLITPTGTGNYREFANNARRDA